MLIAVANGLSKGMALAFVALAARLLTLEEFGQLAVVMALGALLSGFVATGLPHGLMWGLGRATRVAREAGLGPRSKGDPLAQQERFLACAVAGTSVLAIIVIIVLGLVVTTGILMELGWGWLPLLAAAVIVADAVHFLYLNLLQGRLRPGKIAFYSILRNGLKVSLLGGLALAASLGGGEAEPGVAGVVLIFAIAPLAALGAAELWRPEGLRLRRDAIDRETMVVLIKYGIPIIISALAYLLKTSGDLLLVSFHHAESEVALYSASKNMMIAVLLLPVAARNLLIPTVAAEEHSRRGLFKVWLAVWGLAVLAAAILIAAGPQLVELIFGSEFEVPSILMTVLPLAALAMGMSALLGGYWLGKGRPGLVAVIDWIAALVALGLYLWLIPDKGAEGAAWGLLAGSLTAALLLALLSAMRVRLGPEFLDRWAFTRGAGMAGLDEADK